MKIVIDRDDLLKPLVKIGGVIERRQTLPILANVLINVKPERLSMTATDLEVEIRTFFNIASGGEMEFTLPARKLTDICKALPEGAQITFDIEGERAALRTGRSRFTLSILPARDYPVIEPSIETKVFSIAESLLKRLIEKTQFAMALQDVRYYLNGVLLEVGNGTVRTVATDGHRLATCEVATDIDQELELQAILPRKAVLEMSRLLQDQDRRTQVSVSSNHVRVELEDSIFTSKLIDGRFPDYEKVIPTGQDKIIKIERDLFRQALTRASILSNEKYRGIRFKLGKGLLQLFANNPEQEEAEEELQIDYEGESQVIGFNGGYLIDVLSVIDHDQVQIALGDASSSALITGGEDQHCKYVIMPMRL